MEGVGVRIGAAILMAAVSAGWPAGVGAQADAGTIRGTVSGGEGSAVAHARVELRGTAWSGVADERGGYRIDGVEPGRYTLLASAVGYATAERTVEVEASRTVRVDVSLEVSVFALDPIVVTGTKKETFVSESPVKVDVVRAAHLGRSGARDLMEAMQGINGLYQQVDCGVCYTNNIRINGMEGPYTSVLIDGMPIMGALASVYGLNGINTAIIERLEIIKGPSSTLYGSEAMGGVVNVVTKDARFTPSYTVDASVTGYGEAVVDASVSPRRGNVSALLSGNLRHLDRFLDENGDGFTDVTQTQQASLFGKLSVSEARGTGLEVVGKYYREDRFGGVEAWTPAHRGSGEVYGESIETDRVEVLGSYRPRTRPELRVELSYSRHDQDSYYGDERYAATQDIVFGNVLWDAQFEGRHDLLVGGTLRWQRYDDNTPATSEASRRLIPGFFVQDEFNARPDLTLLGGVRFDHHRDHGAIVSPRTSVKWRPFHDNTIRLNAGTGFRVVNLFTEDHAALTGSREVVIAEALEPERSYSAAVNVNQVLEFGPSPMMIDLDLFYTHFSNRIIPDYDVDPNLIVYENLSGHGVTRGAALSFNQNVLFDRLLYNVGATVQDVYTVEDGHREREFFAPDIQGTFGLTYNHPRPRVTIDYTGSLKGAMRLPEYEPPFERATESPIFSVHNLKLSYSPGGGLTAYAAVRNLFDYRQESPLIDPANPFGERFDTNYVYGPIYGRSLLVGLRYAAAR